MISALNVVQRFAAYDRELLQSGYKGRFMIHLHKAEKAGPHWDLRMEFPVESLADSLKGYGGKRKPESTEPLKKEYPDKPGTVYRSFVTKKMKFPSGDTKIYLVETEDHPTAYGSFEGTIPEGYGAGDVEIYDKGHYELLDVEGDKKYIVDFKGKKLKGIYALVKYQKGYLWVRTKDQSKKASAIDYPRPTMAVQIWDLNVTPPKLRPNIRSEILSKILTPLEKHGMVRPLRWISGITLSGSIASNNYTETGDLDVDVQYNSSSVRRIYPDLNKLTNRDVFEHIKKIVYEHNDEHVAGTPFTYSFMVLEEGDHPAGDNLYDILEDRWIKGFNFVPLDFDPDKAFARQKMIALGIAARVDMTIGAIVKTVKDLKKMDQYIKHYGSNNLQARRVSCIHHLEMWCKELDATYNYIWSLQKDAKQARGGPRYLYFGYSPNWDERMVILKYLARYGYQRPIVMLYEKLKGDPYLEVIDKFIPD